MTKFFQHPVIRRGRIVFRWCRICVWLMAFLAVAAVAYLRLVGLPEFVKRPMLERLLERGVAAKFSNMLLGWERGPTIIIEHAAFSQAGQPLSPRLSARRGELELSWEALLHSRIEVRSLQVADAQLQLPISETNGDLLSLNKVALDLEFYSNDVVRLNNFHGDFRGINLDIIGTVSHASAMSQWQFPSGGGNTNAIQAHFREVARIIQQVQFTGTPVLQIETGADGRDMNSFHTELNFAVPAAHTPWGDATNLLMEAACARLVDHGPQPFLRVKWSAASLATPWARGRNVSYYTSFARDATSNLNAAILLEATRFDVGSNGFGAGRLSWNGSATLSSSNFAALAATGKLHALEARTPWGSAHDLSFECTAAAVHEAPSPGADWGPWAGIAPWILGWKADLRNIITPKLLMDHVAFAGHWRAPQVVIEDLQGELYGGQINAGAILDIGSRELHCDATTDLDPHSISYVLNPATSNWLAQLAWTKAPRISAQLRLVFNPWTNRPLEWAAGIDSSLQLAGDFSVASASYRQVTVGSAQAHVTFTNGEWNVSHLRALRPDGELELGCASSARSQNYRVTIDSLLDPKAAVPLLPAGREHVLDALVFKQPPAIHAEIWGNWNAPNRTGFAATILATNFTALGEPVTAFATSVEYTNQVLLAHDLSLFNDQCRVVAPLLQVDLGTKMVTLTNMTGTAYPAILQRLLGSNAPGWLNNVRFDTLPDISVSGSISLIDPLAVDLHFLVSGQRLHYDNLFADRATGRVDWIGPKVTLTNIVANLYHDGTLMGWIAFDYNPQQGSIFGADFTARNIDLSYLDLSSMATGIAGKTNLVEGRLDGDVSLDGPNASDTSRLHGRGRLHAHDALLWDIKLLGLLTPVLNTISPGWGHSRAHEATADFAITNGIISSDNLEMRCTGFRLNFRGKVNIVEKGKPINARLEATVSRDTPLLGPFLSIAFSPLSKLFEYHLTGPLHDPTMEPVFVPRFLLFMMHPFHSSKSPATPETPPLLKDTQ